MSHTVRVVVLILILSMWTLAQTLETISCPSVNGDVTPCLDFIKTGGNPSSGCCSGVKNVAGMIKAPTDKEAVCNCIKKTLEGVESYDPAKVAALPDKCGASIKIPPIDQSTDCSKTS